jgi:HTH-type transcriptional regulator, sugar sensing transcriptional regulator
MKEIFATELTKLGLTPTEAQVYLALLQTGATGASALATATGLARTAVYPSLTSLADKGLVEGGIAYGSKFAAVAPDEALPALIAREKQTISEREQIAGKLAEALGPLAADSESAVDEPVQILRTRHVINQRRDRLILEAERTIDVIVKAPLLARAGNPAQKKAQRRGVHSRALYERAVLDDPAVKPYLQEWIRSGEDARVYDGELPYKLVIFDQEVVLMTLTVGAAGPSSLLVRHGPLAKSLTEWFNLRWQQGKPIGECSEVFSGSSTAPIKTVAKSHDRSSQLGRNGRRGQPANK